MKFEKAIILGVDQLAYQCAKTLKLANLPVEVFILGIYYKLDLRIFLQ